MSHEHIAQNWAKIILALFVCWCAVQVFSMLRSKIQNKKIYAARSAMRTYIRTGQKSDTFNSLGSPLISTAERWRDDYINERRSEVERQNVNFTAVQRCPNPNCQYIDVHKIVRTLYSVGGPNPPITYRKCSECSHEWHAA
jgi:hypothetical protein